MSPVDPAENEVFHVFRGIKKNIKKKKGSGFLFIFNPSKPSFFKNATRQSIAHLNKTQNGVLH